MAARGSRSNLAFGLVTVPVQLYKTSEPEKAPTWEKAGPGGGAIEPLGEHSIEGVASVEQTFTPKADPLADNPVTPEPVEEREAIGREAGTGRTVFKDEVRRGLRDEDGNFRDLTDGIAQIAEETKLEEMRVADFISTQAITRERITGSYWLSPEGPDAARVLALMYAAMRETRRVGVVRWTKRSRQSVGVLVPVAAKKAIAVLEVAWADDLRELPDRAAVGELGGISASETQVAVDLVEALSSGRDALDSLKDDARALRDELIRTGVVTPKAREEHVGDAEIIDLMARGLKDREALKRSAA